MSQVSLPPSAMATVLRECGYCHQMPVDVAKPWEADLIIAVNLNGADSTIGGRATKSRSLGGAASAIPQRREHKESSRSHAGKQ